MVRGTLGTMLGVVSEGTGSREEEYRGMGIWACKNL